MCLPLPPELARLIVCFWLISPIDLSPTVPHRAPEPYWKALQAAALQLEIVSPAERWIEDFRSEVNYVRRHARELRTAPPLDDCRLLPPRYVALIGHVMNLEHQHHLEARRRAELHHADGLDDALQAARQAGEVWELIDKATKEEGSWVCRRRSLAALRELLGPEAYYSGWRPPPVLVGVAAP